MVAPTFTVTITAGNATYLGYVPKAKKKLTERKTMRFDEQGIHIHQSDLKNHCLEKLRLETVAVGPRIENDAATVGTALHAVVERELAGLVGYNVEKDAAAMAAAVYVELLEEYSVENKPYILSTFNSHDRALDMLAALAAKWYRCNERQELLSAANSPQVEWKFDLPFTTVPAKKFGKRQEEIPVFLSGTADIVYDNQVWDWKTAGSEYRRWEYQRWGRQPDVYTWAAVQSGLVTPDRNGEVQFLFKVFLRNLNLDEQPQTVSTIRSANNWGWLETITHRLVNFAYNMGLDREWPLDDQHVLCSPKWCTFFDMCKGQFVSGETWV